MKPLLCTWRRTKHGINIAKKSNMAINVNTAACGSFIPSTPDRQAACTPVRVPTAPAEKHVGAGVATAHWPLATDDDEPAAPTFLAADEWTGGAPHGHRRTAAVTAGRGRFDHRGWGWAAEIKESCPLKYVLNLLVSSESAPGVLSGTASCIYVPPMLEKAFNDTSRC
jgi:hypothetical protein